MKKTFVILFLSLAVIVSAMAAPAGPDIDPRIVSAFQKEFSFAKNVKWQQKGELVQVNFSLYDHGFVAWYNLEAELVSTARNILYMQLPLSVIKTLQREYAGAEFSGIVEVTSNDQTIYQIRAEIKNKKYLLEASSYGNVNKIKRIK
jgi:hypothetical protein